MHQAVLVFSKFGERKAKNKNEAIARRILGKKDFDENTVATKVYNVLRHWGGEHSRTQFWDWYKIGGRWTGTFDGYDPDKDPRQLETCHTCVGLKKRKKCSVCNGTGKVTKYYPDFHEGDVIAVENLTQEILDKFSAICSHKWGWTDIHDYTGHVIRIPQTKGDNLRWIKKEFAGMKAVIVDCHN